MWKCEIWSNFVKNWYFVNSRLIKVWILKILLHICNTYNCEYLPNTTFRFYSIDFQFNADFPYEFAFFTVKSPSVTQRSVSQENAFKTSKKTPYNRKSLFYSNWKQSQVFKIAKFEFKVTVHPVVSPQDTTTVYYTLQAEGPGFELLCHIFGRINNLGFFFELDITFIMFSKLQFHHNDYMGMLPTSSEFCNIHIQILKYGKFSLRLMGSACLMPF